MLLLLHRLGLLEGLWEGTWVGLVCPTRTGCPKQTKRPVIFRGLRGDDIDPRAPLAGSRFGAAYGSANPAVAATYATPSSADLDKYGGRNYGPENRTLRHARTPSGEEMRFGHLAEGGSVYPVRASRNDVLRYVQEDLDDMEAVLGADRMRRYEDLDSIIRNPAAPMAEREAANKAISELAVESDFNTLATKTPKGRTISIGPFGDPDTWAEYPPFDPSHLSALPEDVYSWPRPLCRGRGRKAFSGQPKRLKSYEQQQNDLDTPKKG